MSLAAYVAALCDAIYNCQGDQLAAMLDLNGTRVRQAKASLSNQRSRRDTVFSGFKKLSEWPHLKDFAEAHCLSLGEPPEEAYAQQTVAAKALRQAFGEDEIGAWLVRPMIKLAGNLYTAAVAAEAAGSNTAATQGPLEACGGELVALFGVARKRTDDPAKRMGALSIAVTLFKIYVTLNNPQLGRNLIAAIQSPSFPPFDSFPASQRVTYSYYLGRMAILDDKLEEAAGHLEYALKHCLKGAHANQRRILYYLVPVHMVYMRLPTQQMLSSHNLSIYADIAEAMRTGNVQQLNDALSQHQWTFIQMGTYLVLEKLRMAVYRRLFRRVQALHAETCDPSRAHQVPLKLFHAALVWLKDEWYQELDECECLVCNLICRNYIKGYVAHEKGIVVLSKQNPFPPAEQLTLGDPL
ncbi:hypothetical protein WJX73_008301 [Symbiochloris irregularis]|uniref:PCI domain-containing protein n=1 Tax=Symbiochloris irregularis TaxID=706552 RepID=A0AAW1NWS2_9CHLO